MKLFLQQIKEAMAMNDNFNLLQAKIMNPPKYNPHEWFTFVCWSEFQEREEKTEVFYLFLCRTWSTGDV